VWKVEFIGFISLPSVSWGFSPTGVRRILTRPKWELKLDFSSKLLLMMISPRVLIEPWWD